MSILQRLRKSAPARSLSRFLRKRSLPAFDGISMYEAGVFFFRGIQKGAIQNRASSMSFSFFLAIFPGILFLFTLIPYIPIDHFQDRLMELLQEMMPANAFATAEDTLDEIIRHHNGKLLSFGFLATVYFSTSGFNSMFGAFNRSIHIAESRSFWKQRLVAVLMGFILAVLVIVGIGLIGWTTSLMHNMIDKNGILGFALEIGRWLFLALMCLIVISCFYYLGPAKRTHWNFISPGAILATTLIIGTSILFAWYVNNFGNYNKLYGSIGTLIVILLWIYYNSMMLLIGFELNAGIHAARKKRTSLLEHAGIEEEDGEEHDAGKPAAG